MATDWLVGRGARLDSGTGVGAALIGDGLVRLRPSIPWLGAKRVQAGRHRDEFPREQGPWPKAGSPYPKRQSKAPKGLQIMLATEHSHGVTASIRSQPRFRVPCSICQHAVASTAGRYRASSGRLFGKAHRVRWKRTQATPARKETLTAFPPTPLCCSTQMLRNAHPPARPSAGAVLVL